MLKHIAVSALALGLFSPAFADSSLHNDQSRVRRSNQVFQEIMQTPDKGIPREILEGAQCVAIIPGEKKIALGFGGTYGKGIATCRNGRAWSAPMFIQIGGGSWGLQLGGQSTDLIMVFRTQAGLIHLLRDKVKIGAGASAAAGPIGRESTASTDATMHAEILTYSRSRGAFAGISLSGEIVQPDRSGDRAMYGRSTWQNILAGKISAPVSTRPFLATMNRYSAKASL